MTQFAFDLPHRTALGRADFLVSKSNAAAIAWIDRWPDWPGNVLALHGPAGCGKTHLVRIWWERSQGLLIAGDAVRDNLVTELLGQRTTALAIDAAERAPERSLLHLYNTCRERGASLLLVSRAAPAAWGTALPDLASRLRAALAVAIEAPDDALLGAVLLKHFADRQLRVAPPVIAYLLRRMERSFVAAAQLADRLDRRAMSEGGAVTVSLARRILEEVADQPSDSAKDCGVS